MINDIMHIVNLIHFFETGGDDMIERALLEQKRKEKGITKAKIADTLGVTYQTLRKKMNNSDEFTVREIKLLTKLLGLSAEDVGAIFLTPKW